MDHAIGIIDDWVQSNCHGPYQSTSMVEHLSIHNNNKDNIGGGGGGDDSNDIIYLCM